MSNTSNIEDVRAFWESTPLWTGESNFSPGTKAFYEEHRSTVIQDCFAGTLDVRTMPAPALRCQVLDLGCGPGFWLIELSRLGCEELTGADLTEAALKLAKQRCEIMGAQVNFSRENAEELSFPNERFTHVNCQGVIHHSPNTEKCVSEIARVLQKNGTASISVYYKNFFLNFWPVLKWPAKLLAFAGAKLKGRGRDKIYSLESVEEIVRMYDGAENPIGKAYSTQEFHKMVEPYFEIEETYLHFFPARSLPFKIPRFLHAYLDRHFGFMIYLSLRKK